MDDSTKIIIGSCLAFYFLPLLASLIHKRLLISYFVIVLIALIVIWGQHFYITSRPDYYLKASAGDAIGVLIGFLVSLGFVFGSLLAFLTKYLLNKFSKRQFTET